MNLGPKIMDFDNFKQPMNYSFDLWDISAEEHSLGSVNLFYQPESPQVALQQSENPLSEGVEQSLAGHHIKIASAMMATEPENGQNLHEAVPRVHIAKMSANNRGQGQQKWKRRKKVKPSPYHNYQKHLNTTLRHLVTFPSPQQASPPAVLVAHRLWTVFVGSESSTKKILHFIFNQFNEYRIKEQELRVLGFEQIYSECSRETLGEAKTFLTELVVRQMSDDGIDAYLETRRIKNQLKFKRYLITFRKELQDGFLKKRFTNRNRKEQMRRQIALSPA